MSRFHTTMWSRLGDAARGDDGALDEVLRSYRAPVLAFLRRKGLSPSDAEDLTQEVMLRLVSKDLLARCDATRGRFRNYLVGIALRVLSERRKTEGALKRGGDWERVSLEPISAPATDQAEFDDLWLAEIVQRAMERVRREKASLHEVLILASQGHAPSAIAARSDRSAGAVRVALHRARKALATALKEEVAAYCSSEEEYAAELQIFARFFGGAE